MGYDIVEARDVVPRDGFPPDFEQTEIDDYIGVAAHTLTGPVRIISLIRSVRYLVRNHIPGDIVECGVWKGGSMMAVAKTLLRLNERERCLWLYDTYAGMSQPTTVDMSVCNISAQKDFDAAYLRVGIDDVRKAVLGVGYDEKRVFFVKGKVEETLPAYAPQQIALLRLDTDWYESTNHELVHLFPRLVRGGVLIIDDYGHWQGARKATDDYLQSNGICMLLSRIDFSARIGVKL
jgi:hypothetical protein